jgi:hypothetical protein
MGITAAKSKYPCPYCKISFPVNNKGEFSVIKKDIGQFKKSLLIMIGILIQKQQLLFIEPQKKLQV